MEETALLLRVAVTDAFVTVADATAVQISASPDWAFDRARSVHVRPPPLTAVTDCEPAAEGPSAEMNATNSSLAELVLNVGDLTDTDLDVGWMTTCLSQRASALPSS